MLTRLLDERLLTCPACRRVEGGQVHNPPLALDQVLSRVNDRIEQGFLRCTACATRYPVLDGVAVIFADVGAWLRQQERTAMWRDDLAAPLAGWLRGAWADDADPNWHRQMLAVYGEELAPRVMDPLQVKLSELAIAARAFWSARLDALVGPGTRALDAGCAVGALSLAAAARGACVLAMDHDMGALRLLARLLREGQAPAPRWRHGGGDFTQATLFLPAAVDPARVAVVATDALNPPLAAQTWDLAFAAHVLDNVPRPAQLLRQLHAALKVGGTLVVASPYDWSPQATPREERLGEAVGRGVEPDPAAALRALLTGALPQAPELAMEITLDEPALPWVLHRHRRSAHVYLDHYVEAVRRTGASH